MRSPILLAVLILLAPLSLLLPQDKEPLPPLLVARTEPKTPEEEKKHFKLPPGFEAQLVACEPEINKPMNLNFDDRGRLWVTTSVEYPYAAPLDKPGRDRVVILEDFDENGRARKATNFAEGLNIPMGVLPLPTSPPNPSPDPSPKRGGEKKDAASPPSLSGKGAGGLGSEGGKGGEVRPRGAAAIVYSTPNLYRLTDTDGDGKADKREVLFGPFGYRDVHGNINGLTWGFDGWVYACHGFANDSEIKGTDGHVVKMNSGNTFRFKPDGSRVEHWTWGQVNPFGMCFDPLGNLYTADCHSRPVTMLLRGGYYQSFGKPHDGLGFAPEICGHDHGSTGLCGIVYYAADHFPKEWHDTIFVGNCVTSRICHDKLEWTGSTPKCVLQPDFLVSDDPWFRPVDIKLGPDGALYVADFYNRIIGHYEVPLTHPGRDRERGRIWRIVYKGTDGKAKPAKAPRKDFAAATNKEILHDAGDSNLTVRVLATNQLVARQVGNRHAELDREIRNAVENSENTLQVIHCMWAAARGGANVPLLAKTSEELWTGADLKGLSIAGTMHRLRILGYLGADLSRLDPASVRIGFGHHNRVVAEILAERPAIRHIDSLIHLLTMEHKDDLQRTHALRIALRNHLRIDSAWEDLRKRSPERDLRIIADVALAVPTPKAAEFLVTHMKSTTQTPDTQVRHIARYGTDKSREELLNLLKPNQQPAIIKAFHQGCQERGNGWNEDCQNWARGVVKQLLDSADAGKIIAAAELCGSLKMKEYAEPLGDVARKAAHPDNVRLAACSALTAIDAKANIGLLGSVLANSDERFPVQDRCAQLLAETNQPEARAELTKALTTAQARLQNSIAFHLASNPPGVDKLLEIIAAGKASPRLLQERGVQQRVTASRLPRVQDRVAELTKSLPPADQKLAELLKKRSDGFRTAKPQAAVGMKVYEKHCAACHQLAGKGAKVGPQLDGIGVRGVERLLEDLIDPNRNIDQAFRASTILLKNGQLQTGLVLREEGKVIVLADAQGKEVRIPEDDVDQRKVSPLSPMPANLIDQITEEEFYQLLAYLLAQRGK